MMDPPFDGEAGELNMKLNDEEITFNVQQSLRKPSEFTNSSLVEAVDVIVLEDEKTFHLEYLFEAFLLNMDGEGLAEWILKDKDIGKESHLICRKEKHHPPRHRLKNYQSWTSSHCRVISGCDAAGSLIEKIVEDEGENRDARKLKKIADLDVNSESLEVARKKKTKNMKEENTTEVGGRSLAAFLDGAPLSSE